MILLSAGHNPRAKGATYYDKDKGLTISEYDMAVSWCDLIKQEAGDIVELVPTGNLKHKVAFINKINPVMIIELHFNSARDAQNRPVGSGYETLYYPGSKVGLRFAERLQASFSHVPGVGNNRGAKEGYYRLQKKFGPNFLLARTKCPALIFEPEFIHKQSKIDAIKFDATKIIAHYIKEHNK